MTTQTTSSFDRKKQALRNANIFQSEWEQDRTLDDRGLYQFPLFQQFYQTTLSKDTVNRIAELCADVLFESDYQTRTVGISKAGLQSLLAWAIDPNNPTTHSLDHPERIMAEQLLSRGGRLYSPALGGALRQLLAIINPTPETASVLYRELCFDVFLTAMVSAGDDLEDIDTFDSLMEFLMKCVTALTGTAIPSDQFLNTAIHPYIP